MEILVLPLVMVEEPRDVELFPREMEDFPNMYLDFSLLIDVFPRFRAVLPSVMLVLPMVEEKIPEVPSSGQPRRPGARSGLNFLCFYPRECFVLLVLQDEVTTAHRMSWQQLIPAHTDSVWLGVTVRAASVGMGPEC